MPSDAEQTPAPGQSPEEFRTVPLDGGPTSSRPEYAETNVSVIREGIRRYGEPFLAYLVLDGVEQRSHNLVKQFEERYAASFPDRATFTTWALERTGLEADLDAFRREQGLWPDDVAWNLDVMWDRMVQRYAVTERLGGVHAFRP